MTDDLTRAVLRVGDGRGFVVTRRGYLGREERVVITAAHCLEHARLANSTEGLPPCHPFRYLEEQTYPRLLAPLGAEPVVWAQCLFADPIADIAVLGQPDSQHFGDEDEAYDELIDGMTTLAVADAPAQGAELVSLAGGYQFKNPTPGEGPARVVLSLEGDWRKGRVLRRGSILSLEPKGLFVCGMSGSPIIDANGAATGVISTDEMNPSSWTACQRGWYEPCARKPHSEF